MKNFKYKKKNLNSGLFIHKNSMRPAIIQNTSCVYKNNVKHGKNQINIFCEKPVSKSVRS